MTWLAPWFLVAGFTIAGPILFHLWRRTPRGRRLFSSTMFLDPSPPRITHRSRIEHWLLLCLRALALLLLAVAFARPVFHANTSSATVAAPEKVIAILVDTSASLQRDKFWPSLMRQLEDRLAKVSPGTHLGLFTFDDRWRPRIALDSQAADPPARKTLMIEQLHELHPGWGSTNLGHGLAATIQAIREFQARHPDGERSEVWLVSDLTTGSELAEVAQIDWPETCRLELIRPEIPLGSNAGLQWVDQKQLGLKTELRVRVSNAATSTRDRFQLGWDSATPVTIDLHVPAGQSRTFPVPDRPAEVAETQPLRLTGDDHEFDNRLWTTADRSRSVRLLYLGAEAPDDITAPRFFLEQALLGSTIGTVTVSTAQDFPTDPSPAESPTLTVWTDASMTPPAWLPAFWDRGSALLAVPRTVDDLRAMWAYLQLAPVEAIEAEVKQFSLLQDIDWENPLLTPFVAARFSDFSGIHFWKHRQLQLPAEFSGRVVARFDDGAPFLISLPRNKGQIWLMTAGWHPTDSQLSRSSKFAPLLEQFLELATPATATATRMAVGDELIMPSTTNSSTWTIHRPDGESIVLSQPAYADTDQPGLYTATDGSQTLTWAVNVPPMESKTDPLPAEQLERRGALTATATADPNENLSPTARRQLEWRELERRQSLWRWLLIAASVVLLAETLLAARRGTSTMTSEAGGDRP